MNNSTGSRSFWPIRSKINPIDLESWRDWLVDALIFFVSFLFPLSMLATFPTFIKEKLYGLIALDVGFFLVVIFSFFVKGGTYKARRYFLLILVYVLTISFYVALGPHYARSAWLVMTVIMTALFFGTRGAVFAIILNFSILMTLYWTMDAASAAWANVYKEPFGEWVMFVVNVTGITTGCALPVGFLLSRLDISLKHERNALKNLSAESEKLHKAYEDLQKEINDRKGAEEELTDAQQRYQALFNSKTNLVFVMDAGGNFIDANAPALELFGYTREDIPDLNYFQLLHPDQNVEMIANEMKKLLETGSQSEPLEIKLKSKDDRTIYIQTSGTIIPGKEEIIGVAQDMMDRKRAEDAKQSLEKQLLQSQKMEAIGTLAGGIAHDFNNSLQAILGFIQILLFNKKKDTADIDKLQKIEAAALRASELTQQLLTFSRKIESKLRPVDLSQEVKQIKKLLNRTIPKMINFELHLQKNLNSIDADPAQIEQVLMNLCINARDAMPQGGNLTIKTENVNLDEEYCKTHLDAVPGEYVMLSVSDNGIGIDKATLEYIFDPFFTTKGHGKGTGLGLAMIYGIVKNHKGHINCYSEPGEGTIFKIYFPVLQEGYLIPPELQEKSEMKGGTETILLVDDEDPIRELAKEILSGFGYSIFEAADGESALEIYKEKKKNISLIILDLIMPGMGGRMCLEEILKIDPSQKVIIVSGYSVNGSTKDLIKIGAKGYIKKPYEMRSMLAAVREVLDQE